MITTEEWVKRASEFTNEPYDYSNVIYLGNKKKIEIICPKHGSFMIRPNDFLNGHMCPKCGIEKRTNKIRLGQEKFIEKARELFVDYDFSKVEYYDMHKKIEIVCPKHGSFLIKPYHLLNGHGCFMCGQEQTHEKQRKTKEQFISESIEVHGDKYDYSCVNYIGRDKKVCIICPIHGEFWQRPHSHLRGQGCPKCSNSILEEKISKLLKDNEIDFEQEKKFDWLGKQRLDFYLPQYNIAIECQGIQHFEIVKHFGGLDGFKYRKSNDKKKLDLCKKNGVKLLYYSDIIYPNIYNDTKKLINDIKNEFKKN